MENGLFSSIIGGSHIGGFHERDHSDDPESITSSHSNRATQGHQETFGNPLSFLGIVVGWTSIKDEGRAGFIAR